jgi:hypothetical protein
MKYLLLMLLTAGLFGCEQPAPVTIVEKEDSTEQDGTILQDVSIPAGIKTDTTSHNDKELNLYIIYAYPTDAAESGFMQQLYLAIDTSLTVFKKTILPGDDGVNTFDATPINYYNDDHIVSIRYIFSSMNAGAVHGVTGMQSFNYDKHRNQPITRDDYFKFATKADTNRIIKILDEEFLELRESVTLENNGWEFYGLSHLDFNIRKDSVCFNFGDYQLGQGPGMLEYRVAKSRLGGLIREGYR